MGFPSRLVLFCALAAISTGCGHKKVKIPAARSTAPVRAPRIGDVETGPASWYGVPYHGRQAANGEIYDMDKLTAAHKTLPFGTWLRVENLTNHKTVDVRITDRGPFVGNRIIDLSRAAAREVELIGPGVADVRLTVIANPITPEAAIFAVQVGLFRTRENALRLQQQLGSRYGATRLVEREGATPLYRVLAGAENSPEAAEALAIRIRGDISVPEAYVVRLDKP